MTPGGQLPWNVGRFSILDVADLALVLHGHLRRNDDEREITTLTPGFKERPMHEEVVEVTISIATFPIPVQKKDDRPMSTFFMPRRQVEQVSSLGVQGRTVVSGAEQLWLGRRSSETEDYVTNQQSERASFHWTMSG